MAREKQGYRDMLYILMEKYPATMTRGMVAQVIGVSPRHLSEIIKKGHIKVQDGKIPIGSVASYLCG